LDWSESALTHLLTLAQISDAHLEKVVQRLVETEQLSPEWQGNEWPVIQMRHNPKNFVHS
jgi:hypothetical protein